MQPIRILPDMPRWIEAVARALADEAARTIERRGRCALALTGGRTPRALYRRLAEPDYRDALEWSRVWIFFGDERAVRANHPDSNYGMAWEAWLRTGPIPHANIARMEGEAADLDGAAARYEALLRQRLATPAGEMPRLDLILLGMGEDGHTASLFPGTTALEEQRRAVAANAVPRLGTRRLTFTFPLLAAAETVWMLATGEDKAVRVAQVLGEMPGGEALPASRVAQLRAEAGRGAPLWWLDRAAAARLAAPADLPMPTEPAN